MFEFIISIITLLLYIITSITAIGSDTYTEGQKRFTVLMFLFPIILAVINIVEYSNVFR